MTGRGLLGFRSAPVQRLRLLASDRAARREHRSYVVEGVSFVSDALRDAQVEAVFVEDGFDLSHLAVQPPEGSVYWVEGGVLGRVGGVQTAQGVAAVVAMAPDGDGPAGGRTSGQGSSEHRPQTAGLFDRPLVLGDALTDPGNVGTLLRTIEASGGAGLVLGPGSADPYNPKAVRASAGGVMRVPVTCGVDIADALAIACAGRRLVGASMDRGVAYDRLDWSTPSTLVLGNESHGVSPEVAASIEEWVHVPMEGRAESLNVAGTGALCLFEASRQRRLHTRTKTEEQSHVARRH